MTAITMMYGKCGKLLLVLDILEMCGVVMPDGADRFVAMYKALRLNEPGKRRSRKIK